MRRHYAGRDLTRSDLLLEQSCIGSAEPLDSPMVNGRRPLRLTPRPWLKAKKAVVAARSPGMVLSAQRQALSPAALLLLKGAQLEPCSFASSCCSTLPQKKRGRPAPMAKAPAA